MLSALQLRFAVFLAIFCVAQAEILAHRHVDIPENPLTDHGFGGIHPRCSWNCTVIGMDIAEGRKNIIFKNRLISFVVQYELKVVDECVNQTLHLNSRVDTNLTEVCQVRLLANSEFPSFALYGMECLLNRFYVIAECIEIRALCILKPERTAINKRSTNYSLPFSLRFARGHLANLGIVFDNVKCKSKMTNSLRPRSCVNISSSTENSTQGHFKHSQWFNHISAFLGAVFVFVFIQYSLVFLCLFSPTMVTENGIREFVLGGASPVSLRGLMGNYFFSDNDTIWHKARTLVLRLLVLPFPFVAPAVFFDYLDLPRLKWFRFFGGGFSHPHLFQPFMMACYGCYFIQAFYVSFFNVTEKAKPCHVCQILKPNLNCIDKLPGTIINHLRMQPLILVKGWKVFTRFLVNYFKMSLIILPPRSRKVTSVCFLRFLLFIISLPMIPIVTIILFLAGVVLVLIGIFITSPVVRLCSATKSDKNNGFLNSLPMLIFLRIFVTGPAILGALFVLLDAAIGCFIAMIVALAILFCEECLPFLACLVLVCYYLWSSYSSFTDQYQDLAVTLFKSYKKPRHIHVLDEALPAEQENESDTLSNPKNKRNVVRIPKDLFDMACEELMPVREGVCKLVLKVTSILCFVLLVFSMIMSWDVGATPVTKALMTFFTGSVPKIAAIYFDSGRQKKLKALITEEEVPKILEDYLNRTSKSNQGQYNNKEDANKVILDHENDELNIEMVEMVKKEG